MTVKVSRRFIYTVNGVDYADQKLALAAAKAARWDEKRDELIEIIGKSADPGTAVQAIMQRFHVFNKTAKSVTP
jgi:CRISPR/Cas system-associated exonuclease Cas4 (RecB family)